MAKTKKTVLLDVDGVTANLHKAMYDALGIANPTAEQMSHWDVLNTVTSDQKEELIQVMDDPTFWENLPLIDGAQKGVKYIDDQGHRIIWVTAPWVSCRSFRGARARWLEANFVNFSKHGYEVRADKHNVAGDFLLDDKPKNITDYDQAHPTKMTVLFEQPYNMDFEWPRRLPAWASIKKWL